ncbi:MAG: HDOD domain-containing protein [Phycisphaerae bacterium]|nr:HDOD domain-containing protein [Phycisphaerae bacterium]NUQ47322.1 HDOD domain-containing protein [Phycisphaerae bacterium]
MRHETLEAIAQSAAVPAMPAVASHCFRMTLDPNCAIERLVELLGADAGIAAGILRLANSALFGAVREIDSLQQAVAMLGLRRIRELVLARCMAAALDDGPADSIERTYFWRRSVTTAALAARLADGSMPRRRDAAFVPGLLADIGVIVLARALPARYGPIAECYCPLGGDEWMQREAELVGVSHAEVSAMALESWRLPESLVAAVRFHHATASHAESTAATREPSAMIGAASVVAARLCEASEPNAAARTCLAAIEAAGLQGAALAEALPDVERDVENLATALGVGIADARSHGPLVDAVVREMAQGVS